MVDDTRRDDDAGRRLLWVLPAALVVSAVALGAFMRLLTALPERPPPPPAIEAQVIELPAPAPPAPPAPPQAAPPPPVEAPPPPPPKPEPKPEPKPPPKLAPPKPMPKPPPRPRPPPPPAVTQPPPPPVAAPPPRAAAPPAPRTAAPSGGHMAARAIYKPMPEIPEALRRRDIDVVAVVRLHVAADGSVVQVELVQATFEPTLNRALLDTLKTWRFFPALDDGKPVADTFDLRLPISVR